MQRCPKYIFIMYKRTELLFLVAILCKLTAALDLPSYVPRCNQVDENSNEKAVEAFNRCVLKATNDSREIMRNGIPELGIPSISYIVIPKIEVTQKSRAISFEFTFVDIGVENLDEYLVKSIEFHPKNLTLFSKAVLNNVFLNGTYHLVATVFGQKVNQNGTLTASLDNTTANVALRIGLKPRKGIRHIVIKDFQIYIDIGDVIGQFENLFGTNEVLNKATNVFLAESTKTIIESAKPDLIRVIKNIVLEIANRLASKIPYDSIFPPGTYET